jgi:hypothetical protein
MLCDIHSMKKVDLTSTCLANTSVGQINNDARNDKFDKERKVVILYIGCGSRS